MYYARVFLLMALLGSQITLFPTDANAIGWCGCGNCWMMYSYPGSCTCGPPYYWCFDDPDPAQVNSSAYATKAGQYSSLNGQGILVAKADIANEAMHLMSGGKCLQNKVALRLLGTTGDSLKFEAISFDGMSTVF